MRSQASNGRGAEVVVMFEDTVVGVHALAAGQRFSVGDRAGAQLFWPMDGDAMELVRVSPGGAIELVAPRHLPMMVELLDDENRPLPKEPPRYRDEVDSGARVATLPLERRARLSWGDVSMLVAAAAPPARAHLPPPIDWRAHVTTGVVAICCFLGLLMIQSIPPVGRTLAIDPFELAQRPARMSLVPPVLPPASGGAGAATASPSSAGKAAQRPLRAERPAQVPTQARRAMTREERKEEASRAAADAGVLALVRRSTEGTHMGAIFGSASALGDSAVAMGDLHGDLTGDATGALAVDGTGLVGRGRGREGAGEGTVGLGKIGRVGGNGYGPAGGIGTHLPGRRPAPIDPFGGRAEVHGPIDKELIRRAVRSQATAFKFCYERQLQTHPELSGRVITRFTIAPNGRVVAAVTATSTLGSAQVDACVADVFRRLTLPAMPPGAGTAIVTYPLTFAAAGQQE